ncbi:MAG TPA: metallophosphoesterase [Methanothrix sp.]|nr:metallophosphoesterase [Methanothrix sp.]HQJ80124.1 metallophosphoesterase [Methanothrix sp.]
MRIIALSDTHLEGGTIPLPLAGLLKEADMILHAGDFVSASAYSALCDLGSLEAVHGNSDCIELKRLLPERAVLEVGGIRIGLVHMASHGSDLVGAEMMAREMEVQVLVFGHIHRPLIERGRSLLICPGSTTLPRMSAPSLAILEIEAGEVQGNIISLGSPSCNYLKFAGSLAEDDPHSDRTFRRSRPGS